MFRKMAESSFTTDETGGKLFHPMGPTIRPFVVNDEETYRSLRAGMEDVQKLLLFIVVIVLATFETAYGLETIGALNAFLLTATMFGGMSIAYAVLIRSFVGRELKNLKRVSPRLTFSELISQLTDRESITSATKKLAASLLLTTTGIFLIVRAIGPLALLIPCVAIFIALSLFWLVASVSLCRKKTIPTTNPVHGNSR